MSDSYDVAIIGSGVAGALIAWRLAEQGHRVVILEAGYKGEARYEMVQRYARAVDKTPSAPYDDGVSYRYAPAPRGLDDYYVQKGPNKFKSTYLRRVGGSTWHWLGNVPRFLPADFKLQTLYGIDRDCDWPISYDGLEPWYCEAERAIGVSGDHDQWNGIHGAYRTSPFPMEKIALAYGDHHLYQVLDGIIINGQAIKLMSRALVNRCVKVIQAAFLSDPIFSLTMTPSINCFPA